MNPSLDKSQQSFFTSYNRETRSFVQRPNFKLTDKNFFKSNFDSETPTTIEYRRSNLLLDDRVSELFRTGFKGFVNAKPNQHQRAKSITPIHNPKPMKMCQLKGLYDQSLAKMDSESLSPWDLEHRSFEALRTMPVSTRNQNMPEKKHEISIIQGDMPEMRSEIKIVAPSSDYVNMMDS